MKPVRFCASCGRHLDEPQPDGGATCPSCGRSWYRNPSPTAGCVIVRDGAALVTVRAHDPFAGRIDVPGGFVHVDEDIIDGLKREVREELGVEIEVGPDDFIQGAPHRYGDEGDPVLAFGFRARLAGGDPKPSDDVADIKWVGVTDLDDLDFAWEHDRELVRKALAHG
ncbi:MAG: NUDIX hydrolase [Actinomycetota bacterium]